MASPVQLRQSILLITPPVRTEDDLLRRALPVVGDVEEIADLVEQPGLPLLSRDVLPEDDHAVVLATLRRTVAELGDVLGAQAQCLEGAPADDRVLDVVRPPSLPTALRLRRPRPFQLPPCLRGQILGNRLEVWQRVVSEYKADAAVVVPAVEMCTLRERSVPAQQDAAEAAPETDLQGAIDLLRGPFVGGAVSRAVDDAENFAGVGQGQDQGVIAPGAVVGDVHTRFAVAQGRDQRPISVDDGTLEELIVLTGPDPDADVVENVEQDADVACAESPTEVSRGGRVGNTAGAQGVEENLVVAPQFDVLETGPFTEGVVGEVEDMVGLVEGKMDFEQVQPLIDGLDESNFTC